MHSGASGACFLLTQEKLEGSACSLQKKIKADGGEGGGAGRGQEPLFISTPGSSPSFMARGPGGLDLSLVLMW